MDAQSPQAVTLFSAWLVMFQLCVGAAAIGQLLIFGHQECPAAREKNKCSLALKSEPGLNPSPSISSRIRATFKEKPLLLSHSGPQGPEVSLGECRRYVGETTLEQQEQDGRANPACQFCLILRLQEQLGLLLILLSSESKSAHTDVYFFQVQSFWLFLLRCLICSCGMMIFLFFPLQHLP